MSEPADKLRRRRSPSAASIIKAALEAGGVVTFPNGITVKPKGAVPSTEANPWDEVLERDLN